MGGILAIPFQIGGVGIVQRQFQSATFINERSPCYFFCLDDDLLKLGFRERREIRIGALDAFHDRKSLLDIHLRQILHAANASQYQKVSNIGGHPRHTPQVSLLDPGIHKPGINAHPVG